MAEFGLRFQDLWEKHYIHRNTFITEDASAEEKMKRASLAIATLVLMSTFYLTLTILPMNAEATTLYVGGGGPGNYTKIQDAIAASGPGDTVFVYSGTYNEVLSISKPLSLFGESKDTTIIQGSGPVDTVLVLSDGVNVTGFSVENSSPGMGLSGIRLSFVQNCHVTNNSVYGHENGIEVGFSSHIAITNSTSSSNFLDGIHIYNSDNITITDSNTSGNGNDGIFMDHSVTNVLMNNVASSNGMNGFHLHASDISTISQNGIFLNGPPGPPSFFEYSAVYLSYSNHSVISENSVLSNLNYAFALVNSNVSNIHNNNFSNNGNCVSFFGANGNRFTNNTMHGNAGGCLFLRYSSHNFFAFNTIGLHPVGMVFEESHDNTIVGNRISAEHDEFFIGGITISASTSHVLADNVLVGDGLIVGGGFFGGGSLAHWNTHVIDTSNTVNGRPVYYWKNVTGGTVPLGASEVILANCTGVVVQNQNLESGTAGIELGFSSNNTVSSNTVKGSKRGIFLYGSDGNAVSGNMVSLSDLHGIDLRLSNRNTISDNDLWGNGYGVSLRDSDNNSVAENNIWENSRMGIPVTPDFNNGPGSDDNTIVSNTVYSNNDGFYLYRSINNTFADNSLVNNFRGMRFLEAGSNWIYHNNIIDNTEQAIDDGFSVQWDDGYPSGGNYWSDYTGVDFFNGPNQDIPGSDWMGDTPYVIDFDSEDRYPLVSPFLTFPLLPSAPRNLQAAPGDQQVTLTWTAPSFDGGSPITNYRIYRGTTSGGEIFHAQIGIALTFPDTGLTNGQLYCYRVSAINGIGEGPLSNEACATPTTMPGAPVILQADLSGNAMENVTVTWDLSSDDGAGQNSVVGYSIYRGTTYNVNAFGYQPVATVPSGTIEFNDNVTGEGDPNDYFYLICSVDLNNLTNCSGNQAGKFTRSLMNGPNLVSFPLIQSDENIETIFQTVKWDKAWTYDSSAQKWKSHMMFKPYKGELEEVNTSMGIWVNVMEQSNLTVAGIVPSSTSIYLHAGWNLVAFPSFNLTYLVGDLKAETGATRVEGFDSSTPPYFLRALADGVILRTGFGYWVSVVSETSWTIDNS